MKRNNVSIYTHYLCTKDQLQIGWGRDSIVQQYGDWYSDIEWMDCYTWYSVESLGGLRPRSVPSSLYRI